ncbi:MAG: gliding motility-associated C-terminal domain-containing protein [Crocinitomicaceae bacterium]|nr:gliding motility-associated C-terminal domain-containing protein [Crocinitomicaceae bacterium]
MKKVITLLITVLSFSSFSQEITIYSDNFEGVSSFAYQYYPVTSVNQWTIAECAGNAGSTGSKAMYVTNGVNDIACGDKYEYAAAPPSTQQKVVAYLSVDGRCSNTHTISFDYKLDLNNTSNVAEIVYSLNGSFWFVIDTLDNATNWTSATFNVGPAVNNANFFIGFRLTYNSTADAGTPLAIDNFVLKGKTSTANIEDDEIAVCSQTTILVNADINAGTGTWTIESSPSPLTSLTQTNSNNTALNNLGYGTTILAWTVVSPDCGNTSDTIRIINSQMPSVANVQDTVYACAANQLNLTTAIPYSGTGTWSSSNGIVFDDINSAIATATSIPNGWSKIIWTVSSVGCPSNADTMNVFKTGDQSIYTKDTTICFGNDISVLVTTTPVDSMQTVNWIFAEGTALSTVVGQDSLELTGLSMGKTTLIYEVKHSLCPKETDTLRIVITPCEDFEPVFPTVITPNGDGKNDLFVVQNLEIIYPNCQMTIFNRYGSVVFESTGYTSAWDGTFKGEKLPMGAYFFKLELNDGSGKVYSGPISLIH